MTTPWEWAREKESRKERKERSDLKSLTKINIHIQHSGKQARAVNTYISCKHTPDAGLCVCAQMGERATCPYWSCIGWHWPLCSVGKTLKWPEDCRWRDTRQECTNKEERRDEMRTNRKTQGEKEKKREKEKETRCQREKTRSRGETRWEDRKEGIGKTRHDEMRS